MGCNSYRFCVHVLSDRSMTERRYSAVVQGEWLCLCVACHEAHSQHRPVTLASHTRLIFPRTKAEETSPLASHAQIESWLQSRAARTDADDELEHLNVLAQLLKMQMLQPPAGEWSPVQVAGQLATLRQRMQDTLDTSPSDAKVAQSQAGLLLTRTVTWLQERVTLAQDTHKRCQRLLRQAKRLLAATRAELGRAFFSRRRTYRRLVQQRQDLAALLWLQAMPTAPEPTLMRELADAFADLHFFYGSPLSDAALRRFIRQLPLSLADLPQLGSALRTCDCAACTYARKGVTMTQEIADATLADCPCAFCKLCRLYVSRMDPDLFAETPDVRDALLAFRERLGERAI